MRKAVIYVRVSDSRQVDNTSLASQEEICRSWCQQHNIEADRVFTDAGESAKTADRAEFKRMFDYVKRMRGSITDVVVYKQDRFSRSAADTYLYIAALQGLGVQLQSATEPLGDTPCGRASRGMLAIMAQFDNETRSERSLNGMKNRLSSGRWCWTPPIGYLSGRSKSGPSLVPDPERAHLITRLFELVASRQHRPNEALNDVTAMGFRTHHGKRPSSESLAHILRNPIYCGIVESKKWGISVRGDFQPLVSREVFDQVQQVLAGKAVVATPRSTSREEFPLRGTVLCTVCRKPLTAASSRGKAGTYYGYYRCFKSNGHVNVRKERVEQDFVELLQRLQPRPERMTLIEKIFERVWAHKQSASVSEASILRSQPAKLESGGGTYRSK